jgi:predicted  nucleic acid-binding Zn-ribbon protein
MNDIEKQILENELALALDAAQKGDKARLECGAMEMQIKNLKSEITRLESEAMYGAAAFQAAKEEIKRLKDECSRLRTKLFEASECIAEWGAYAEKYFQEKHHLERDIAEFKEAAMQEE